MSGGPFRVNQQQERRATVARPEPVRRQPEEAPTEVPAAAPRVVHSAPKQEKASRRFVWPIVVAVVLLAIVVGCFVWMNLRGGSPSAGIVVDSSKYQAVFFTNGQVYFGKLQSVNQDYLKLTDIFYLQAAGEDSANNPQNTTKDSNNNVQLIKLGDEIHGPEDEMIISKEQILFYENLKTNSKVSETIKKYKN
ncbi:MAG TPA: hypothetical protein VGE13_04530 [Candidatus Saccharimonadales bacterium]